jgi:hypothetical protein
MNNFSKSKNSLAGNVVVAFIALVLVLPARAMFINITYDSSVTSLTNAAQVEAAFNFAAQTIQNLYTNPITMKVTVIWGNTGLGASSFSYYTGITYKQVTNFLNSSQTSTSDKSALASLPANNPAPADNWFLPTVEAKLFNFGDTNFNDGSITFASNQVYTLDPNNRTVPGKFDFIGVAEHEITEIMGRSTGILSSGAMPYDLFRFTNSAARSFDPNGTNAFFSIDNGLTALDHYNTNGNGGDIQDWASSTPPDAYNAFVPAGQELVLSAADITSVDILGYNLNYKPPQLAGIRSGGTFQLSFTNIPGTTFTVLASTNVSLTISNWTVLGTISESSAGQFQFTDTHATNALRFYRLRLN